MTAAEIKYHTDDLSIQDKTTILVYATTAEEKGGMTYEQNVRAILESNFAGFKDEIIDIACKRICELTDNPYDRDCDTCIHHVTRDGKTGCESWKCEYERREE